jgi:MarR family transcriptional regulator, organic hydroperoxide resistance regulator
MAEERDTAPGDEGIALSSSLLIEDQLCFGLYAASRAVTSVYRPLLERLGLTYPQYLVMLVLWQRGPSTIKEVMTVLHLDYGTLTPLLKRLETLGHVRRERRPDDERSVRVSLTEAGAALRAEAAGVPVEISRALGLTASQTAELAGLLTRVRTNATGYAGGRTG